MTISKRFQQKRAAILEDKFLSEAGKQAKLKALFDEMEVEVQAERVRLAATEAGLKQRRAEILKQQPPKNKLPQLPIKSEAATYISDFEKSQLATFATIAGLLAEQRAGKRLVAAVVSAETPEKARQALERAMMVEPFAEPALVGAYSEMLMAAESKFAPRQARSQDGPAMDSGDLIGLSQFRAFLDAKFKESIEAGASPEQRSFFESNQQALDDLSATTIKNVQDSIGVEATWADIQSLSTDARLASFTVED